MKNGLDTRSLQELSEEACSAETVSQQTALAILRCPPAEMPELLNAVSAVRAKRFGRRISLCAILNAKSGACGEDCAFCAQSAFHDTAAQVVPLLSGEKILEAYRQAQEMPIERFSVVTSGKALGDEAIDHLAGIVEACSEGPVRWCASLGCLTREQLARLKRAGVQRFHHNLETARTYFPNICSTHTYDQRLATLRAARDAGLEVCSGGILGMGETLEQRVELAFALAREAVESIPLNFLIPVQGTPLGGLKPMKPVDIIRSIAMFRAVNPASEIRVCGGRSHLRDLQALIFYAGATGMMVGPLLTVAGRNVEDDFRMLEDLEVEYGR